LIKRKSPVIALVLLFAITTSLLPPTPASAQISAGGASRPSAPVTIGGDDADVSVSDEDARTESLFQPVAVSAVGFAESMPVRDMPEVRAALRPSGEPMERGKLRALAREKEEKSSEPTISVSEEENVPEVKEVNTKNTKALRRIETGAERTPDEALFSAKATSSVSEGRDGREAALAPNPPTVNFDGISIADTIAVGQGFLPPDTVGEVGPNHYVQAVNSSWRVWDKAGNPLTPVMTLGSLWANIPGPCANSNDGDPVVNYDQMADRWVISQFCVSVAPSHQLIAVSKTGDPTGAYYLYDFVMPNNKFNDYPHFGVWPDGYYMTNNQFNQAGTAFQGAGMYAFDRAKMLAGNPTAGYIYFDSCPTNTNCVIGGMLPSDLDGLRPPPAGAPNPFAYFIAGEFGDPSDGIRIFDFKADFATPANSTFTERTGSPLAVAAFDPVTVPNSRNVIPQPLPAAAASFLDAIGDRLMYRLAYRNFGTHETLAATHTVNAAANPVYRAGVRVYELRRAAPAGPWAVQEQQTFAGGAGDTTHRWMGSAAINHQGDLAVGYSASSLTLFPSVRYAARLGTDPAGTGLAQGEQTLVNGGGSQTSTSGRWGDYSSMTVDPVDDCAFWYTQEYYSVSTEPGNTTAPWKTRVSKFAVGQCTAAPTGTISGTVTNCETGLPVSGALVSFTGGYSRATDANGNFTATLPPGTYDVTFSGTGYNGSTTNGVVITNGGNATANGCLTGTLKQPIADGRQITAESCNANNALDPNETVTVNFGIKNTGTLSTSNLVATLQATGGVTNPGSPQSYGVVVAGGATVSKPFTFTVGNVACGSIVTATLQLQDGATDLGTITYTFTAGTLLNTTATSGNIVTPLPDNTTVDINVPITDAATISDVNVSVRMNHTFTGDVRIDLIHPDGTLINLVNRRGGSGDNFGTGANNCSGTPTTFDDQAATLITAGTPPYAGAFRPEALLSALNGKSAAGTWKLRFNDNATDDAGLIGCVTIEINRRFGCCGALPAAAPPAVVIAESVSPANNAPDPEETVTVNLPVVNNGLNASSNLTGALQASSNVVAPSGPQNYGAVPAGGTVSRPFTFTARGTCGSNITLTLQLQDGATNYGTVTYTLQLGANAPVTQTFSNSTPILIPGTGTGASTGAPANPYPSNITVSGLSGTISKVTVTLTGLSHTFPSDVDMLLVGPAGQKFIMLSDVIGGTDWVNINYTLDDAAAAFIPTSGTPASGTFKPTNATACQDPFPTTAPAGPYLSPGAAAGTQCGTETFATAFNGSNPNGTWSLYIVDDTSTDAGTLAGGWSLNITAAQQVCQTQTCSIPTPANVLVNVPAGTSSTTVNYAAPSFTGSCGVVTASPASGSVFPAGNTTVNVVGTRGDGGTTAASFTVRVNTAPTVSVSVSPSAGLVAPASTTLTATAADPGGSVAQVEFFDGMNSLGVDNSAPFSINYNNIPQGPRSITAVATDGDGATATSSAFNFTVAPPPLPPLIISEFRLQGTGGTLDEFVEIYNNSDSPHTVNAPDGSAGYSLAASDGVARFTIPNGTVIPARGHYLGVNSVAYSLASYPAGNGTTATGDATYTADIPLNAGIALFNSTNAANFTLANRLDAVGSAGEANTLYKEGTGYPNLNNVTVNHSLYRDLISGLPKDTGQNDRDFIVVDTSGTNMCTSTVNFRCQRLGAPGPENLSSPIARTSLFPTSLVAPCVGQTIPPNRVRDTTPGPGVTSTFGTLDIRRRFTNLTGANVSRLRFRIVDITTFPAPVGVTDFRALTSDLTIEANPCGGLPLTIRGTTLEQANAPADQPFGGAFNSTLSAGTITLATPLPPGASVDVKFLLGVQQTGSFRFFVIVEALP
jgi:subtilisin-like proprotein convertase family protein